MQKAKLQTVRTILALSLVVATLTSCDVNTSAVVSTQLPTDTVPNQEADIFAGHYVASFEVSSFVPCSMGGLPGYGAGYWLESIVSVGFYALYEKTITSLTPSATQDRVHGVIVFIRFRGDVSPQADFSQGALGGYGHLGQYSRMITVTEILEMAPHGNNQC